MTMDSDPNHDIWIGDVLNAWRELKLTDPLDRAAVAEALGFEASELRQTITIRQGSGDEPPDMVRTDIGGTVSTPAEPAPAPGRVIPVAADTEEAVPTTTTQPIWLTNAPALPAEEAAHQTWRPTRTALFQRQWVRHILSAVAAVPIEEGTIDEPRLIESVSRLRPVDRLPRRKRPTLRRGLHVLLDKGRAMMPFAYDAQEIVTQLRSVVGRDSMAFAAFEETPLSDVVSPRLRRRVPWRPPASGTPILVISDLGLTQRYGDVRGAAESEWLEFAAVCRASGCPITALVPRGEADWPPVLRRAFTILPWDRSTTVSVVLRYLRASGGRV
jgi:hypothetical protein